MNGNKAGGARRAAGGSGRSATSKDVSPDGDGGGFDGCVGRWFSCCGAFFSPSSSSSSSSGNTGAGRDGVGGYKAPSAEMTSEDPSGRAQQGILAKPPSPTTVRNWRMSGGLMRCLQTPWGYESFKRFAEKNNYGSLMVARINFIRDCLDYKTDGIGSSARVERAARIWDAHLDSDLPDPVDVDRATLRTVKVGLGTGAKDLFDAAAAEIAASPDVSKAFNKFLESDEVGRAGRPGPATTTTTTTTGDNNNSPI